MDLVTTTKNHYKLGNVLIFVATFVVILITTILHFLHLKFSNYFLEIAIELT